MKKVSSLNVTHTKKIKERFSIVDEYEPNGSFRLLEEDEKGEWEIDDGLNSSIKSIFSPDRGNDDDVSLFALVSPLTQS